ncbi:carboxypeptidase-like regulatory domain-containing protein [Zeaxanthinibacter enoshimensis]|uniref:carboxypeptidase-like regulatory domain-containing protein n=1 Tax=Zeaxanthinibacter enoshimensis TaxID=392009 RepID=UPI001414D4FD|nr:carboxypeptidase-like regulatory domain-containing protein [Zeaxanthinibacter enoshimensis]
MIFKKDSTVIPGAIILVSGTKIGAQTNVEGEYFLNNINPGTYDLVVSAIGYGKDTIPNINVSSYSDSLLVLGLPPGPCYDQQSSKFCPVNEKCKSVIPIVYGLPDKRLLKKVEKGKIRLGGCEVTGCEPHWYCDEHEIEF